MTYADLLRCIAPYNYGEIQSNEEQKAYLDVFGAQISELLKFADADENGTISFTEYYFFVQVLQLPLSTLERDFKEHEGNKMTAVEFSKAMTKRRKQTSFGAKMTENSTGVLDGRNVKATEIDFLTTNR